MHAGPDFSGAHIDLFVRPALLRDHRAELFLHAEGAASAADISRDFRDILHMDHPDIFLAHARRSRFQIDFLFHREHEHIIFTALPLKDQRLKRFFRRDSLELRHLHPVDKFRQVHRNHLVVDLHPVKDPHCIRFHGLLFGHNASIHAAGESSPAEHFQVTARLCFQCISQAPESLFLFFTY